MYDRTVVLVDRRLHEGGTMGQGQWGHDEYADSVMARRHLAQPGLSDGDTARGYEDMLADNNAGNGWGNSSNSSAIALACSVHRF